MGERAYSDPRERHKPVKTATLHTAARIGWTNESSVVKTACSSEETASGCAILATMRWIAHGGLLVMLFGVAAVASARDPFRIPNGRPSSIRDVVEVLRGPIEEDEETDEDRHLPAYLEGAQCGGWDKGLGVEPYIADVQGLPGRPHDWDGDVRSGMATRTDVDGDGDANNDYAFPDDTIGLTTACDQKTDRITKTVWAPARNWVTVDGENVVEYEPGEHEFAHPYFEDPACRWRWEGGAWPGIPLAPDAPAPPSDKKTWETEDEQSCTDLCLYLNSFLYEDCLDVQPRAIEIPDGVDADGEPVTRVVNINVCERTGNRYICTDKEVQEDDRAAACAAPHPVLEEFANARMCVGQQCRCPNDADPAACVRTNDARGEERLYQSYYRTYREAGYERDALHHAAGDVAAQAVEASCFGFYDEFDPLTHQTQTKDRRCVINVDVENMRETQVGKATYKEAGVTDKDPTDEAGQRPGGEDDQPGEFDDENDTWYKKLGGAISFVNERVLGERYGNDLANVFLDEEELDDGALTATPQINDGQPYAQGNHIRAFDDTGQPRVYSEWWQEQQTRMATLLRPPVLRVILPSAWFAGLDKNDPFLRCGGQTGFDTDGPETFDYTYNGIVNRGATYHFCPNAEVKPVAYCDWYGDDGTLLAREPCDKEGESEADRADLIELQIEADDDTLGEAMAYLERSLLLHIEEEPIHVLVPLGSPVEFRARAADWCNWYKADSGEKTCDNAPQDIKDVMTRLEEYAARIDEYRALRTELAEGAAALLDLQQRLLTPIAEWFTANEEQLKRIADGRVRAEAELLPAWRQIQTAVALLQERGNLPWCMNQRFTSPILTQLDPWLASRAQPDAPINANGLPTLPDEEPFEDVIADFSAITLLTDTLKLPVVKPVQVRIDLPAPPTTAPLAALPPIQDIQAALDAALGQLPSVNEEHSLPTVEPPEPMGNDVLEEAEGALTQMLATVSEMNARYERFWKSIGPLKPGGEEQFDRQIEFKTQMKCRDWNDLPCDHPEMNLLEIVQRIGSRPLVQLKEDFDSAGVARTDPTECPPDDHACHLLHPERTDPEFRWEIHGSIENEAPIEELRTEVLTLTQPPPVGSVDPLILAPNERNPSPVRGFPEIRLLP